MPKKTTKYNNDCKPGLWGHGILDPIAQYKIGLNRKDRQAVSVKEWRCRRCGHIGPLSDFVVSGGKVDN